jgi:NTE family protein
MRPKVGLVLGSGASRGIAHIGVLKVLERENIPVDILAGCSIGSIIGSLYLSGYSPELMLKLAKHLRPRYWLDIGLPKMGILSGNKFLKIMRLLTKKKHFADLQIPFAIVATEIVEGREVIFTEGELATAVRASISVPGIFVPFKLDNMLLVDGAVLNPTPIDAARNLGAEMIIAVDLAHASIISGINSIFDVILQSIDLMERELSRYRQPTGAILIRPEVSHIPPSSFEHIEECVRLGEAATERILPEIFSGLYHG